MNKFGIIACLAAAAALSGCLDPKYVSKRKRAAAEQSGVPAQTAQPRSVDTWSVDDRQAPAEAYPATPAIDVTVTPTPPAPADVRPVAPVAGPAATQAADETTSYVVQPGDTLDKIARRFGVTRSAIKAANPKNKSVQKDIAPLGQKILLPGRHDVGEQKAAAPAAQKRQTAAAAKKPYTGATTEYVVKPGDNLGSIAKAHKTTSREIAEINGIDPNKIRPGQKLRIPAAGSPAKAEAKEPAPKKEAAKEDAKDKPEENTAKAEEEKKPVEPAPAVEQKPAPQTDYFLYTVKDGEDITGISITYDLSPSEIRQLNNMPDGAEVTAGMELKLPAGVQQ